MSQTKNSVLILCGGLAGSFTALLRLSYQRCSLPVAAVERE